MSDRLIIAFTAIMMATLSGCKSGHAKKDDKVASSLDNEMPVVVSKVISLRPAKVISLPGELKAWDRVDIFPKTKSFVKTVAVDRGTVVKKGQILAVLEAPELLAELNQVNAQLQAALAKSEEAKSIFKASKSHYHRLLQTSKTLGAVSANELEQIHSKMISDSSMAGHAKEQVNSSREMYNSKRQMVNYLTITAPFDGVIMDRNISPGTLVGPETNGQTPLFVLVNNMKLRLTVAVPEVYSNSIQAGAEVSFTVHSIPGQKFKAKFARSAQNIDHRSRIMMTEFDVSNPKNILKAGMYSDVKIPVQRSGQTLFVPGKAVITSSEKVFVIQAGSKTAEWLEVKKGNVVDTLTEVFGDLKEGDVIVKNASEEIKNGQKLIFKD